MSSALYSDASYGVVNVGYSPSLLFNNLTCNGHLGVFMKGSKVVTFQEASLSGKAVAGESLYSLKDKINGTQAKWCLIGSRYYLVCTSYSGVQIFGDDGKTVEYVFPLKTSDIDFGGEPEGSYFTRGITAISATNEICVGASTGHIFVFSVSVEDGISLKDTKASHKYAISSACGVENVLATGDDYGNIILCDAFEDYENLCRFQGKGHPCTGLVGKNGYVVASYASGHLRVFNIRQQSLYIEAAAHSRAITGMDMHPSDNLFVTVGEDSILSVWSFPEENEGSSDTGTLIKIGRAMKVQFSTKSDSAFFTGVQFTRNGTNTIFASVYDQDSIRYWSAQY
eukprot:g15269.t1